MPTKGGKKSRSAKVKEPSKKTTDDTGEWLAAQQEEMKKEQARIAELRKQYQIKDEKELKQKAEEKKKKKVEAKNVPAPSGSSKKKVEAKNVPAPSGSSKKKKSEKQKDNHDKNAISRGKAQTE
ncbi:hypothetical protein Ddc_13977 [Ditylenchus destructor]|nr:hypothetical protein Ddc_13977 [Ditylenchus destructor]